MRRSGLFSMSILILSLTFIMSGCATAPRLKKIHLGMTQNEVRAKIGKPLNVIDSKVSTGEEIVEVWEYKAQRFGERRYWLYFSDGVLVEWHRVDEFQMGRPVITRSFGEKTTEE